MTKTQVAGFVSSVFSGLEGSRFVPARFKTVIEQVKAKVVAEQATIADGLPENFTTQNVIDKLFALAEAAYPQFAMEIEVLKWVADRFLATPPTVA